MLWTRAQLAQAGLGQGELRARLKAGTLRKVAPGAYTNEARPHWPEDQHRQVALGFALTTQLPLSHVSAAVLHGLPVPTADLSLVHFTKPGHSGGRSTGPRRVHTCALADPWVTRVDGVRVTTLARTVADVARSSPQVAAVAAADAALHSKRCTPDDLVSALAALKGHAGIERARAALMDCDGRAESSGESRTRLALAAGLPATQLQISVYDTTDDFVGRTDGGWPEFGVLWEYDGEQKYGRLLKPGQDVTQAVLAEKRREQRLTELGWFVIRVEARDLRAAPSLRARFRAGLARAARPGWTPPDGTWTVDPSIRLPSPGNWA